MWWPGAVGAAQAVTDLPNRPMRQRYEVPEPGQPFDPAIFRLGSPCKRDHLWDKAVTLRTVKQGICPICARIDASARQKRSREIDRKGWNAKVRAYKRQARADGRIPPRSKHGRPYTPLGDIDTRRMRASIKRAGRLPSVARLVYNQQLEHWRANPADRAEHLRQCAKRKGQWRYLTDPSFRLYHRSKSKRRKAQERGSRTVMLSPDQMWRRWVEFDNRCAYCGVDGDLQVEHVIPISQGGEHHLGNIVPACERCNYSKGRRDVNQWYRSQSFFNEARWLAIQSALTKGLPPAQLSLLG